MRRSLLAMVVMLLAGCAGPPGAADTAREIAIVTDFPISGVDAPSARPIADAAAYPVIHAGSDGRYHFVVLSYDDSLAGIDMDIKGVQIVRRSLRDPRVLAIVGPMTSSVALSEIPLASEGHLAMISPSTTRDCLTIGPTLCSTPRPSASSFFRLAASDSSQGTLMAEMAVKRLHLNRFAVFYDGKTPLALEQTQAFAATVQALGGTVVLNQSFDTGKSDFSEQLRHAADGKAQAVYASGFYTSSPCRLRAQMRGIFSNDAYLLGSDYLFYDGCIKDAGSDANEHMIASEPVGRANLNDPRAIQYLKVHPNAADIAYTFAGYDCSLIVIDAIKRAIAANDGRKPTREQVVDQIAATQSFRGITGTWSFNENHDATSADVSFRRIESGQWEPWTPPT